MRIGFWMPWYVWLMLLPFAVSLALIWAIATAAAALVAFFVAWAITRDWRRAGTISGLTFSWMLVPSHMARSRA